MIYRTLYLALRGQHWLARLFAAALAFVIGWLVVSEAACPLFYRIVLLALVIIAFIVGEIVVRSGENAYYTQITITLLTFALPLGIYMIFSPIIAQTAWAQQIFCPLELCPRLSIIQGQREDGVLDGAEHEASLCVEQTGGECQSRCAAELARVVAEQASKRAEEGACSDAREKLVAANQLAAKYRVSSEIQDLIGQIGRNVRMQCDMTPTSPPVTVVVTVPPEVVTTIVTVPPEVVTTIVTVPPEVVTTIVTVPPETVAPTKTATPTPRVVPPATPFARLKVEVTRPGSCNPLVNLTDIIPRDEGTKTFLDLFGTMNAANMARFTIDAAPSSNPLDNEYKTLFGLNSAVVDGKLGSWDITEPRGVWTIRAVVVYPDGNYNASGCKVVVSIAD